MCISSSRTRRGAVILGEPGVPVPGCSGGSCCLTHFPLYIVPMRRWRWAGGVECARLLGEGGQRFSIRTMCPGYSTRGSYSSTGVTGSSSDLVERCVHKGTIGTQSAVHQSKDRPQTLFSPRDKLFAFVFHLFNLSLVLFLFVCFVIFSIVLILIIFIIFGQSVVCNSRAHTKSAQLRLISTHSVKEIYSFFTSRSKSFSVVAVTPCLIEAVVRFAQ